MESLLLHIVNLKCTMYCFFLLSVLISLCVCAPRTPRIYNVLISTKKNLAPSQALPVYEPVLRTTSVGLAFPPLIYTPIQSASSGYVHTDPVISDINAQSQLQLQDNEAGMQSEYIQQEASPLQPQTGAGVKHLPRNVLPIDQYVPYYTPQLGYDPYYPPKEQQQAPNENVEKYYENLSDPKQIVANLKKNPNIPDVPPPPLPVKS